MFNDHALNIAYKMGAYRAIAEMMAEATNELAAARNEYERTWATHKLMSLAEQFKETEARLEEKVDSQP
jgi:hypothetical protein